MAEIDYSEVSAIISAEVTTDISEVRQNYLKYFRAQAESFINAMSKAYIGWREFDSNIGPDIKKAHISALIYCAINNHIVSMKLFLSGYIIAAGNLQRQVIESIALALLCSAANLDILDRYMDNKYSTNKAVRDVLRHYEKLNLNRDALHVLERSRDFYDKYSHLTQLTLANLISFSESGKLYLGATFDEGKLEQYTKEVNGRVSLAIVFDNFIDGVKANVKKW
jgi:hypothetical protein